MIPRTRLGWVWLTAAFVVVRLGSPTARGGLAIVDAGQVRDRADAVQVALRPLEGRGFSGAVLIADGGGVWHRGAYGWADRAGKRPTTLDTRYQIASITKSFTAAAVLSLAHDGHLSLNDSVRRYLPDVPLRHEAITINDLLTHHSGLAQLYAADGIVDRRAALAAIFRRPLQRPGAGYAYSNDNYTLLAMIVEAASGRPFEEYVRTRLLDPAGLTQTSFWGESHAARSATFAVGLRPTPPAMLPRNWGYLGCTGMWSTVDDLYRWQRSLIGEEARSEKLRHDILTIPPGAEPSAQRHGWSRGETSNGLGVWRSSGAEDTGFNGTIRRYDGGLVLIVLTNAGDLASEPARNSVVRVVEGALFPAR